MEKVEGTDMSGTEPEDDSSPYEGYDVDTLEHEPESSAPRVGYKNLIPRAAGIKARAKAAGVSVGTPSVTKKKFRGVSRKNQSRLLARQRQGQALELRKAGATYSQIAAAVGYADASSAAKAVKRSFAEIVQEPAHELRVIQQERLNNMLVVLWPQIQGGDQGAIRTSLSVMAQMDALNGTLAAQQVEVKHDHSGSVLVVDGSPEEYIRALKQMTGIDGNGTNIPALPAGAPPSGDMHDLTQVGMEDGVIEADWSILEGNTDTPVEQPAEDEIQAMPTRKVFSFGMDPTARRSTR